MKLQQLALFPLPSHILPGGKLPLRLFEPRHLQMLKESFLEDRGFGIVMEETTSTGTCGRILPVGTRVKVTDFYTLNDGLLGSPCSALNASASTRWKRMTQASGTPRSSHCPTGRVRILMSATTSWSAD